MSDNLTGAMRVAMEIVLERENQIASGYGHADDDRTPTSDLAWLLARRSNDLQAPSLNLIAKDEPRRLLVEIAAIAVAAIESIDRRAVPGVMTDLDVLATAKHYETEPVGTATLNPRAFPTPHPFTPNMMGECSVCVYSEDATVHSGPGPDKSWGLNEEKPDPHKFELSTGSTPYKCAHCDHSRGSTVHTMIPVDDEVTIEFNVTEEAERWRAYKHDFVFDGTNADRCHRCGLLKFAEIHV
jgi:hypothetical protein